MRDNHRYLKKSRLLKFCYVPTTSTAFSNGMFEAANNSTNQANKEGIRAINLTYMSMERNSRVIWAEFSNLSKAVLVHNINAQHIQPILKLKTRHGFCPVGCKLNFV
jgi:hypothetical protein